MKTLTLYQPWATLVAIGAKRIETRSWKTDYRGALAIQAGRKMPVDALELILAEPFRSCLGRNKMPMGFIVTIVELVGCRRIDEVASFPACKNVFADGHKYDLNPQERAFGDYSVGRYMWLLEGLTILDNPIPAKGMQGLWDYWEELR